MNSRKPIKIDDRIHLIDGFDLDMPSRTGSYVIQEDKLTLVETGPSNSIPYILKGLNELQLDPKDIEYIIVTHIHLDHSGGAGLLLKDCPNAKIVVHPRGARHLVDPSRLVQGARAVYGEDFDRLFSPVLPIAEEKLLVMEDGDTLQIGENCTLTFYDTPGHADHHFSIHDPISNGIFTGDTLGVRYEEHRDLGEKLFLPSTSPSQFKPDAVLSSLERIKELNVSKIYFGHFGAESDVEEVYRQIEHWLPIFMEVGQKAVDTGQDYKWTAKELVTLVQKSLHEKGVPDDHPIYGILSLDMEVCTMGIHLYIEKLAKRADK
ncbi:MBL fold metallo-hydrolase [Bacillus sp. FJAT-45350]|uniref:MBL fold metallo-hydrolase n=1 Tax=Bacillus sp. FJAT-45350 TaxID=2011014 RepID=UPI000BB855AF|nr:MBL fold metallo-hydrolase [Bacillus sp. FJAT-45350]